MAYFTTKQKVLFYDYTLDVEQKAKLDDYLQLLEASGVAEVIKMEQTEADTGRPEYNPFNMFACVLYGYATGSTSLRELESSCLYDLRFKYLSGRETPSYMSFCRYINTVIKPHQQEIFSKVNSEMLRRLGLDLSVCFIDGSKFEADANKYKFVWKPTTYHEKTCEKTRNLLAIMGLSEDVPETGLLPSGLIADKLSTANKRLSDMPDGDCRKVWEGRVKSLTSYLERTVDYEEKEEICGPNRNSYYKTDHDATAMCLKEDYYSGLGSNMHAAYQVQMVVSSGLVVSYYISQDRADYHTFIPAFEVFHSMYGFYPKSIGADAGYGSSENYSFCERNGIQAFIKYQSWEGECSGRRPAFYEINQDGSITCLGGRTGQATDIPERHHKYKNSLFYQVYGCLGCAFMAYCRQFMKTLVGDSKVFEVDPEFQRQKQKARDLLLSVQGIEMRVNRGCQSEGGFGIVKQDMAHDRFSRIGMPQVDVEFMLDVLGLNIRKYLRYSDTGIKSKFWVAPAGTEPQKFKKPSAKILSNRVHRRWEKQRAVTPGQKT